MLNKNSSETTRSAFYKGSLKNSTEIIEWLVGITDGAGTFHFRKTNTGVWSFTFKIRQSNSNLRLLYYIKSILRVGSVSVLNAEFNIQNIQHIIQYILPIFDKYPLLTRKHFNYNLFREAILIKVNPLISNELKDKLITNLKAECPTDYISPA